MMIPLLLLALGVGTREQAGVALRNNIMNNILQFKPPIRRTGDFS